MAYSGTLKFKLLMKESMQNRLIDFFRQQKIENDPRNPLLMKLEQSCSLFTSFWMLSHRYFDVNGIEKPNDPALCFNRKLTSLATSFMKRIQQDLIAICWHLNIELFGTTALLADVFMKYRNQASNFFISQSVNLATIKCSNRNIFVSIDALKQSEYFRSSLDMHHVRFDLFCEFSLKEN